MYKIDLKLKKFAPWKKVINEHAKLLKDIDGLKKRQTGLFSKNPNGNKEIFNIDDEISELENNYRNGGLYYKAIPRTDCCEMAKKARLVRFAVPYNLGGDGCNKVPAWQIAFNSSLCDELYSSVKKYEQISSWQNVLFCPYCGVELPKMIKVEFPESVKVAKYGEDYCETCNDQLGDCICLPPSFCYIPERLINE